MVCKKKFNICLITSPIGDASVTPVSNLAEIITHIAGEICLITGNAGSNLFNNDIRINTISINYKLGSSALSKIIRYLLLQLKISYYIIKKASRFDTHLFFIGSNNLILPAIISKIMRKNVILSLPSSSNMLKFANDRFYKVVEILESINLIIADKIIVYSPNLVNEWNLKKYSNKILFAHEHFINFNIFKLTNLFHKRENLVGYVGRLSGEKGVLNFIKAIGYIISKNNNMTFLIIGDGPLKNKIELDLDTYALNNNVKLFGWVPHDELPYYLNQLKLTVLPSYTEGLPNLMLESMACGTPILATPIGTIPDVITDGKNGFIMENNSPECIADNLIRALAHPNLEQISKNAEADVNREFTFENAVGKYRKALCDH
ncbi:glycosyltransferase family 4 protein [Methanosarcina sp. Z-7115]|uniref:Glycosyltransferase family 4 protein n=1 Tax=Methanosarcina baikalica TaxID=3073890 RepID=A0ABU2CZD1_9EURY|nr:glycosyltransferase family 4 protein [Methanosarcina sp. Z-7115]MDR7665095.1 glycosyltransferase family 4 protein [Methanosarcina sp. Z-7115]